MIDVLTEFFVSFSSQVKIVKHVLVTNEAITPDKAWVRIQINRVRDGLNGFLQGVVHLKVFLTKRVGLFSSRKQTLK